MTEPWTLFVALMGLCLVLALGWFSLPSAPPLAGERLFKTLLVTLLRGAIEADDGDEEQWEKAVIAFVPS